MNSLQRITIFKRKINFLPLPLSCLTVLIFCAAFNNPQSQEKVYTLLMLNFARGIQWPESQQSENFIIGVFEYPPLAAELSKATSAIKVSNKKIEIREFTKTEDITGCH